jgi:hypothetical protein
VSLGGCIPGLLLQLGVLSNSLKMVRMGDTRRYTALPLGGVEVSIGVSIQIVTPVRD